MEETKPALKPLPADRFELMNVPYESLPWFRQRWFIVITILLFMPLTLCIVLSGDIYIKRKHEVYKMLPKQKKTIITTCCLFMAFGVIRLFASL